MKSISLSEVRVDPTLYLKAKAILDDGGLLCFPTPSGYKIAADLNNHKAIISMLQAKRRVKNAPALVFVPQVSWVDQIAEEVSDEARLLMENFWPGPLTLLFEANESLHPKIRKPLTKAKGWIGVRQPHDEVSSKLVEILNKPILVSSANISKKQGSNSVAQVKKNFGRTVNLLIDAGDLTSEPKSTLVNVTDGAVSVIREEAVSKSDVSQVLGG